MNDQDWQGGKKDQRLYRKVRAEKQKVIRQKYDQIEIFLDERSRRLHLARILLKFNWSRLFVDASLVAVDSLTKVAFAIEKELCPFVGEVVLRGAAIVVGEKQRACIETSRNRPFPSILCLKGSTCSTAEASGLGTPEKALLRTQPDILLFGVAATREKARQLMPTEVFSPGASAFRLRIDGFGLRPEQRE